MEIIENKVSSGVKVQISEKIRRWGRPRLSIILPESDTFSTAEFKKLNPNVWTKSIHDRLKEMIKHDCIIRSTLGTYKITNRELATEIGANMYNIFKTGPGTIIKRKRSPNKTPLVAMYLPREKKFRAKEFALLNPDRGIKNCHKRLNDLLASGSVNRIERGLYETIDRPTALAICAGERVMQVVSMLNESKKVQSNVSSTDKTILWFCAGVAATVLTWVIYRLFLNPL